MSSGGAKAVSDAAAAAEKNGRLFVSSFEQPLKVQHVKKKKDELEMCGRNGSIDCSLDEPTNFFVIENVGFDPTEVRLRRVRQYNPSHHRPLCLKWGKLLQVKLVRPMDADALPPDGQFVFHVKLVRPMDADALPPDGQFVFHVTANYRMCHNAIRKEEFEIALANHASGAKPIGEVMVNELLVFVPNKLNQSPLRCRVLKKLDGDDVRVYAVDVGRTFIAKIFELREISDDLASMPFRVSLCTISG
ncbi:unnamed protein product [Gongylonema pulchrum]|uniref:Tudor domain-containing protein n=1 Tax=Gongylonema pulchrum TaxID=637853 RepID=A0A183E390_9BILA|nr:unnamed protein product [Gongylonema pulchrum]